MIELKGKYTDAKIFANTIEEGVISQVYDIINCRAFEGQKVVCMPDVHVGASGPCGLVATIGDYVCPEHIGVDIGCSVSMLLLNEKIPEDKYAFFESEIRRLIPFAFKLHKEPMVNEDNFYVYLYYQFRELRKHWPEMLTYLPDTSKAINKEAKAEMRDWVKMRLKVLGMSEQVFWNSLGTVGGGNHFIEYDEHPTEDIAGITFHFGSRHFGVKVCTYWMKRANEVLTREDKREIADTLKKEYEEQGRDMTTFSDDLKKTFDKARDERVPGYLCGEDLKCYLCDMCFAQAYAQYNHYTVWRIVKEQILHKLGVIIKGKIYTTHNYINLIDHTLRKSAVCAYDELFLVPFNMRDGIAICEGKSNQEWLNSCAHGAGRKMSRSVAKEKLTMAEFKDTMKDVYSTTVCEGTIDEAPMAYKDTDEIKELIKETCDIKCMLVPKINIKAT